MDFFDKAVQKAKEVGSSVVTTAASVGNSISSVTKEQTDLANLRVKRNNLEKKLQNLYISIGKAYVEVKDSKANSATLDSLYEEYEDLNMELKDVKDQILVFESKSTQNSIEKEKKKAELKFETEKEKLERALAMDIITADEYEEKLSQAQKRLDSFDSVCKIELQYEMDIISKEEYEEKMANLLK